MEAIVDSDGITQKIVTDETGENVEQIEFYNDSTYLGTKKYTDYIMGIDSSTSELNNNVVPYASYAIFYVYHSDGTKTYMSNLVSNTQFIRQKTSASQKDIQTLFDNNNSPLKNNITIYKKDSSNKVYNTGTTVTPAKIIYDASVTHSISPKVILTTLQKESSLVSSYHTDQGTALSARAFWFCMGA